MSRAEEERVQIVPFIRVSKKTLREAIQANRDGNWNLDEAATSFCTYLLKNRKELKEILKSILAAISNDAFDPSGEVATESRRMAWNEAKEVSKARRTKRNK